MSVPIVWIRACMPDLVRGLPRKGPRQWFESTGRHWAPRSLRRQEWPHSIDTGVRRPANGARKATTASTPRRALYLRVDADVGVGLEGVAGPVCEEPLDGPYQRPINLSPRANWVIGDQGGYAGLRHDLR